MKVELLVNLKLNEGIVSKGVVYDADTLEEMPDHIKGNIDNPRIMKILIPETSAAPVAKKEEKAPAAKKEEKALAAKVPVVEKAAAEPVKTVPASGIQRRRPPSAV